MIKPGCALSRRDALAMLAALPAGVAAAQSTVHAEAPPGSLLDTPGGDDPALAQMLADFEPGHLEPGAGLIAEIPPLLNTFLKPNAMAQRVLAYLLTETPPAALPIRWAGDADSIDYAHLGGLTGSSSSKFEVTGQSFADAARYSSLPIRKDGPVLFALRGCRLIEATPEKLTLTPPRPDLRRLGCVVGVWRPDTGALAAFPGSTTPSLLHTHAQIRLKNAGRVAGLLPTGLLPMTVGTHRPDSARPQPGALRLAAPVAVLRDYGRAAPAAYGRSGGAWMLDGGMIAQGIHAASLDQAPYGDEIAFSSSGSVAVGGGYDADGRPTGDWAAFRRAAGLLDDPSANDGKPFELLLLTGSEMRLQSIAATPEMLKRLRFGSNGPAVLQLQAALGIETTGVFNVQTQIAVLTAQLHGQLLADGVVTPSWARDRFKLAL